jgi:flagellar biosynthetic protein FliR
MSSFDLTDLFVWLLAMFRAGGLLTMMPFFLGRAVPRSARVALAALLAWMAAPYGAEAGLAIPAHLAEVVLLVTKELAIGLLMGLAVRIIFFTLEFAAQVLAVGIGLHPGSEFDPSNSVAGNPVGSGLFYLAVILFLAGAHYAVVFAFARSFQLVPPGLQAPDASFVPLVVSHTARIFQLGVLMSAPVLAVNFLVNLTFSILGRVVPRMNVFVVSFSVRIGAGLAMLALSTGLIAHYIMQQFGEAPEAMLRLIPFRSF